MKMTSVACQPKSWQIRSSQKEATRLRPVVDNSSDYDDLYQAHHAHVLRLCRLLLSDPHEADDVSQEIFVKLLREQRAAQHPVVWERWLTTVTVNACRDRRRSGWWKWWRERHQDFDEAQLRGTAVTPEEAVSSAETMQRIWAVFRTLSARQQEVFALRQLQGWSTDEVAEALGLSAGSVKRHLYRAVHQLRTALRGYQ